VLYNVTNEKIDLMILIHSSLVFMVHVQFYSQQPYRDESIFLKLLANLTADTYAVFLGKSVNAFYSQVKVFATFTVKH